MTTAAFDSLRAARDMESAGLERAQAEAIAEAIRQRNEHSATNADVSALRGDIANIKAAVAGLEMSINQLRNWFVSGLVTILVAIAATALLPS